MWYVYIIQCEDRALYTGITNDLNKRFQNHQQKRAHFTSYKLSIKIIYSEMFPTRVQARRREIQIKGWTRAKKLALANNNLTLLKKL